MNNIFFFIKWCIQLIAHFFSSTYILLVTLKKIHLSRYTIFFIFKRLITTYNIYFYTTFFLIQYLFIRKIFQISSLKNIRVNHFIIKLINTLYRLLSIFNFANCFLVHKSSSKLVNILIKPVSSSQFRIVLIHRWTLHKAYSILRNNHNWR